MVPQKDTEGIYAWWENSMSTPESYPGSPRWLDHSQVQGFAKDGTSEV